LPTDYTVEVRIKVAVFGGGYKWWFYDGEHAISIEMHANKVKCRTDEIVMTNDVDTFYVFRFVVDSNGHAIKVYRDNVLMGTITDLLDSGSFDGRVRTESWVNGEAYEDYFKIASGLYPAILLGTKACQAKSNLKLNVAKGYIS